MRPRVNSTRKPVGMMNAHQVRSWNAMISPIGVQMTKLTPIAHSQRRSSQRGFGSQANAPTSTTKPKSSNAKASLCSDVRVMAEQYTPREAFA
jgi:hypothetical protein